MSAHYPGQRLLRGGLLYTVHECDEGSVTFSVRGFPEVRTIRRAQFDRITDEAMELPAAASPPHASLNERGAER